MPRQKLAARELAAASASPGKMMVTQDRLEVGTGGGGRRMFSGDRKATL